MPTISKWVVRSLAFLAVALTTFSVRAGWKDSKEVFIFAAGPFNYAAGAVTDVRYSADSTQDILCSLQIFSSGKYSIYCRATDSSDRTVTCTTTDKQYMKAVQAINESSYINFSWDSNNKCTAITVESGSMHLP